MAGLQRTIDRVPHTPGHYSQSSESYVNTLATCAGVGAMTGIMAGCLRDHDSMNLAFVVTSLRQRKRGNGKENVTLKHCRLVIAAEFEMFTMNHIGTKDPVSIPGNNGVNDHDSYGHSSEQHLNADSEQDLLEPIAVIGFSLTFPRQAISSTAFWQMLMEGKSALTNVPESRYNWKGFYDKDPHKTDATNVNKAHFVEDDIAAFDAPFFSITPEEAACMDPQQRWLLEGAYRSFENGKLLLRWTLGNDLTVSLLAGISLEEAAGSKTSVYIGSFNNDYQLLLNKDSKITKRYFGTGTETGMLANRLSWFYDLRGPSMQIDTACSSSLNALHLACQSIRSGESDTALVGGCNLFFNPESMCSMSDLSFLSPDGISYAFDHRANGYSRGEGLGIVLLKPLFRALDAGDTIRAVVRATGSNQDGRTPGITQPSTAAQITCIRDTYKHAGLTPRLTRFFEAHGTGTPLGDPLEARAIHEVFGEFRSHQDKLIVGALKSNIGHLEGASGIASLIKTILVLESGMIPPNLWFERVNPRIPLEEWNIKFPTENDAYHFLLQRGLAGLHNTVPNTVSLSTNKANHRIGSIESQGSNKVCADVPADAVRPVLLVFSASDMNGLDRWISSYQDYFAKDSNRIERSGYLQSLAFTLGSKRSHLAWRSHAVISSTTAIRNSFADHVSTPARSKSPLTVAFVFTGQGAHWSSMGKDLFDYPIFAQAMLEADQCFRNLGCTWSLFDELFKDEGVSKLGEPGISQPTCTALQVALVKLLRSWSIEPVAVVGHSSGEIAAAYASGAVTCSDALRISFFRGLAIDHRKHEQSEPEAMMAVGLSETDIRRYLDRESVRSATSDISIGCINRFIILPIRYDARKFHMKSEADLNGTHSPRNVTLTGNKSQLSELKVRLAADQTFVRFLNVERAYHSRFMDAIGRDYLRHLRAHVPNIVDSIKIPMVSSVSGKYISPDELRNDEYWVRNLTSPVRFADAVQQMLRANPNNSKSQPEQAPVPEADFIIEIGPSGVLRNPIKEILAAAGMDNDVHYQSVMVKGSPAVKTIMHLAGSLHSTGYPVTLKEVNKFERSREPCMLVDLPPYPFNHSQKYWIESRLSKNFRFRKYPEHELLGTEVTDWNSLDARWRKIFRLSENEWVADHKINDSILLPAAAVITMAIEAAKRLVSPSQEVLAYRIQNASFTTAIVLSPDRDGTEIEIRLGQVHSHDQESSQSMRWDFQLFALTGQDWSKCSQGTVILEFHPKFMQLDEGDKHNKADHDVSIGIQCGNSISSEILYSSLLNAGVQYGPTFQTLTSVAVSDQLGDASAIVRQSIQGTSILHPTILDGMFQLTFPALHRKGQLHPSAMLPTRVDDFWVSAKEASSTRENIGIQAHAHGSLRGLRHANFSIVGKEQESGATVISMTGFQAIMMVKAASEQSRQVSRLCYNVEWSPSITSLDNSAIGALCSTSIKATHDRQRNNLLKFSAGIYILRALREISAVETPSKPHLRKYLAWMRFRSQILYTESPNLSERSWTDISRESVLQDEVLSRLAHSEFTICQLYLKVGPRLPDILDGSLDALTFLFNDELLAAQYATQLNDQLASKLSKYMDLYAHQNPDLKILEAGAGTGGVTKVVLQALTPLDQCETGTPRFSHYTFTDISAYFIECFREIFRGNEHRAAFKIFDVEQDPADQDMEIESYDFVFAANDFRQTTPLVDPGKWDLLLRKAGFSGVDIDWPDHSDEELRDMSIMISTASDGQNIPLQPNKGISIITNQNLTQQAVALDLQTKCREKCFRECELVDFRRVGDSLSPDRHCILLVELTNSILLNVTDENLDCIKTIMQRAAVTIWITGEVTESRVNSLGLSMATGLIRTLQSETTGSLATLALESRSSVEQAVEHIFDVYVATVTAVPGRNEVEYREIDGRLQINRIVEAKALNRTIFAKTAPQKATLQTLREAECNLALGIKTIGSLDSLEFVEDMPFKKLLSPEEVDINVKASGIDFRDILIASGLYDDTQFGLEMSGVVVGAGIQTSLKPGERVYGWVHGSIKTAVRCGSRSVQRIPEKMSFVEAASIPIAYCTAYHSLVTVARIREGDSILIQSGAAGTGQAAIQLAKHFKASIYTTVGSEEEGTFLQHMYGIPKQHIFFSRDLSFRHGISKLTHGRGVDVVLTSLRDEAPDVSMECLAPFGRFVNLGRKNYAKLSMALFSRSVTFATVDPSQILREKPDLLESIMKAVEQLFKQQVFTVMSSLNVYGVSRIVEAFKYLQSGNNSGKTVISMDRDEKVMVVPRTSLTYHFDPNASYLIAGGLGGIGRSVARWMVDRGAKNLILLSRSMRDSEAVQNLIADFDKMNVRVATPPCDIVDSVALAHVLDACAATMPPIKGCIQACFALSDGPFFATTSRAFHTAIRPKAHGSWNLHTLLPSTLDFFILLSSALGIVGGKFQSNYACGNVFQDALARHRVRNNQKALSIDIGIMRSVGYVAERQEIVPWLETQGYMSLEENELHAILEVYCDPNLPVLSELECQIVTGLHTPAAVKAKGLEEPPWLKRPLFSHLRGIGLDDTVDSFAANKQPSSEPSQSLATALASSPTFSEACDLILSAFTLKLSTSLAVPESEIDISKPTFMHGADSLSAVGISHWLEREMSSQVSVFEILEKISIRELSKVVAKKSVILMQKFKEEVENMEGIRVPNNP
ncbi:MAG: hypothetical protein Q9202_006239 [Teloschistes flavicans]